MSNIVMNNEPGFSSALDESLAALARGKSLSDCLDRFPEYSDALRPLLEAASFVRGVELPVARPEAVERGQTRMLRALESRHDEAPADRGRAVSAVILPMPTARPRIVPGIPLIRIAGLVAMALLLVATALFVRIPGGWLPGTGDRAGVVLAEAHGVVEVRPARSGAWALAARGRALYQGDAVRTQAGASARLAFDDGSDIEMQPDTEIVLVRVPGERQSGAPAKTLGSVIYQASGQAHYRVREGNGEAESDQGFEVQTPAFAAVTTSGIFELQVARNGATELSIASGHAVARAGDVARELVAGDVFSAAAVTPPSPEAPGTAIPGSGPDPGPPSARDDEEEDGSDAGAPPGLEDRDSPPPGLDDKDAPPPGLDDRDAPPPGLDDRDAPPPGLDDKDDTPPGSEDKDDTPPGLDDKDNAPPGLEDKDDTPPGLDDKDVPPPGQSNKDGLPPDQENKDRGKDKDD